MRIVAERIEVRMQWKVIPHGEAYCSLGLEYIFDSPWCRLHIPKAVRVIKNQAVANMSGVASVDKSLVKRASMQDCPPNLNEMAKVFWNVFFCSQGQRAIFRYIAGISVDRRRHKFVE